MPKGSKRTELGQWIAEQGPEGIGEREWVAITEALAPVSASYLRRLVRDCGVPLTPMVEGVRQEDFEELERSLVALAEEYEAGDGEKKRAVRALVIEGKDHAKMAARRTAPGSRKDEMILWMLTWLENPPLFPQWVKLRRHAQT